MKPSKADYDPLENEQIKPLAATTPTTPKNEIPNKFWAFVEPYCAPLQQEDVKFLEDLIKGLDSLGPSPGPPPLPPQVLRHGGVLPHPAHGPALRHPLGQGGPRAREE